MPPFPLEPHDHAKSHAPAMHTILTPTMLTRSLLACCLFALGAGASAQDVLPTPAPPVDQEPIMTLLPIHDAARRGDIDEIRAELAKGVNVNVTVTHGQSWVLGSTALTWAAFQGETRIVEFLLGAGADPNIISADGTAPIFWASGREGSGEMVEMLVRAGADLRIRRYDGSTPLVFAASFAHDPNQIKALVKGGANLEERHRLGNMTPLMVAARVGNTTTLRALLEAGARVDARAEGGVTALMWAAEGSNSNVESIRLLIDAGADIEARTDDGSTALMIAALHSGQQRVRALIDAGANPRVRNQRGDTAIMAAARKGDSQTIDLLVEYGVDVNATNDDGTTALMLAVTNGEPTGVRCLIEHGAKVNAWNSGGWTPLLLAKGISVIEPLIEAGADVNVACNDDGFPGWTPLMFACFEGDLYSVRKILNAGANINARDSAGRSALTICRLRGTPASLMAADILEARGARP